MTTPLNDGAPGSALVPFNEHRGAAGSREVVGTVAMLDGALVVRVEPTRVREATTRLLPRDPDPQPTTLTHLRWMRYVGPLTPEQTARFRAEVARWDARPWWRRWPTDVADWCWRWRR